MIFYALLTTFSALLLYFFAFERKNRATRLYQKPKVNFASPTAPRLVNIQPTTQPVTAHNIRQESPRRRL